MSNSDTSDDGEIEIGAGDVVLPPELLGRGSPVGTKPIVTPPRPTQPPGHRVQSVQSTLGGSTPVHPVVDIPAASLPPAVVPGLPRLLATVGAYGVGKDYVLKKLGYRVIGFADPLYVIAEKVFGTTDKKAPGIREFLQTVGQWGRGTFTKEYPYTLERFQFGENLTKSGDLKWKKIREKLLEFGVVVQRDWGTADLWSNALRSRIRGALANKVNPIRLAVSNVRFFNEADMINSLGGQVWYVAATKVDLKDRRQVQGSASARASDDVSEQFAKSVDKAVRTGEPVAFEGVTKPVSEVVAGVFWNSEAPVEEFKLPVTKI